MDLQYLEHLRNNYLYVSAKKSQLITSDSSFPNLFDSNNPDLIGSEVYVFNNASLNHQLAHTTQIKYHKIMRLYYI